MFFPTSLLCVILLLLGGITLADGEILSAEQTTRLREFIETVRRCHDVPSIKKRTKRSQSVPPIVPLEA